MKTIFYFSLLTVFCAWLLLLVGGLVNPMGASMACPDWYFFPTCNKELLPNMVGGILYEHGHRLMAFLVGLFTVILAFACWGSSEVDSFAKKMALGALSLVVMQGILGGVTVLLKLSVIVSTLHLFIAMLFFSLLVCLAFRLSRAPAAKSKPTLDKPQISLLLAICLVMIQLIYGGLVRHLGAGLACGQDLIGCGAELWPSWSYGRIHMGHRLLGYGLFLVIIVACLRSYQAFVANGEVKIAKISVLPVAITIFQIIFGLLAVHTARSAAVLTMHTGFGALLLASLLIIYMWRSSSSLSPALHI